MLFTSKIRDGEEGIVMCSFYMIMVFVPNMGLSQHIFGNRVKQGGNNSHFSIRLENLARGGEPAGDRSKFSTCRRETRAKGVRVGMYNIVILCTFKCRDVGLCKCYPQ